MTTSDFTNELALHTSNLEAARQDASRRLADLRNKEQAVKDSRVDFERSRTVVNRMQQRLRRHITGKN